MENKRNKEQKARQDWMTRMASSRQGMSMPKEFVPHPASEELLKKAQELLQLVMAHPSTPKSRNLPDFINMDDKSPTDDQIDYDSDNDENDDETSKKYRRSYMPPEGSILLHYLEGVKEKVRKGELIDMAKGQKSIPSNEDPVAVGLKSRPVPDIFYKNVCVEVWAPMEQFQNKCHAYECPFCHEKNVKQLQWAYRPAFNYGAITWILHKRLICKNNYCLGGRGKRRTFATIDPRFVSTLPTSVARKFDWIFPAGGPGVHVGMQMAFCKLSNEHILFSSFTNMVNELQKYNFTLQNVLYLQELLDWLDDWPSVDDYNGVPPLCANGYDGTPLTPYSAFGKAGEHNGILMTEKLAKAVFNVAMEQREPYMQRSFQSVYDEGLSADDTYKFSNRVFVNTSGRSRVQPFGCSQTMMSKQGRVVVSRLKFTKAHNEVTAILTGLKEARENAGAPDLKWLTLDNPDGDKAPYEDLWPHLLSGTVSFYDKSNAPKLRLGKEEYKLFKDVQSANNYILSVMDKLSTASPYFGLDTEFERYGGELTVVQLSYSNLPVIVLWIYKMGGNFPVEIQKVLEMKRFVAAGRNVGIDCGKLENTFGIVVPNRLELRYLALADRPELGDLSDGTSLSNLVAAYMEVAMPVPKSIGQSASYSVEELSDTLVLYAAVDAFCHRRVAEEILGRMYTKKYKGDTVVIEAPEKLNTGSIVNVLAYGKNIATGCVLFHGLAGKQRRWGDILIGKDKCLVQVDRIAVPGSKPPIRYRDKLQPDSDWPKHAAIGALWDLFEGNLILAVKTSNLEIVVTSDTESAQPPLATMTALTTEGDPFVSSPTTTALTTVNMMASVVTAVTDTTTTTDSAISADKNLEPLYTRSLRDIFHQFHNLPLAKNSPMVPILFQLIIAATYIKNDEDLQEVETLLASKGVTDFIQHEFFNRSYWRKRVRMRTPTAAVHAANIRFVKDLVEHEAEFKPFRTDEVLDFLEKYVEKASRGIYQQPDDVPLFIVTGIDVDGLTLYASEQGTVRLENIHQKYAELAGPFAIGIRTSHYLLVYRTYRYNISTGIIRCGEPDFGHDHHELIDEQQHLILAIFSMLVWPAHKNLLDFQATDFVSIGIGPLPISRDYVDFAPPLPGLSADYNFMCQRMGLVLAPLGLSTHEEFKIYNEKMRMLALAGKNPGPVAYHDLAKEYKRLANGKTIFPKTPDMLLAHQTRWKLNRMIKSLNLSVKVQVGEAMENFRNQRIEPPRLRQFPMPDVSSIANSSMWEKRNFVPPPAAPYQKMYVSKQIQDDADVKQPMLNQSMAGRRCANFPRCCLQVGICGGITKKGCVAFQNKLLLELSDNGEDDETTLIKKRKTEQKKAQRLLKRVKREATTSRKQVTERAVTDSPQASPPIIIMVDSITISGPKFPHRGAVIVQPVDSMALFQTGSLINDNVVQGYLNMLAHKAASLDIELHTLAPQFYPVLSSRGWDGVARWLQATRLSESSWETSPLIFLPIFLGPHDSGHWTSLIADRTVLLPSLLAFSDSLPAGTAALNSNQVARALENTPLFKEGHLWINTDMVEQASGSNDCAVFMLLTFATYLLAVRDAPGRSIKLPQSFTRIQISNCRLTAGEFGRIGRRHIYDSICAGKIELDDEAIRDLKIQFT
jgi:hypothetical protein